MPKISIRGTEMPASPIRKLAPLADAAKQRGIHVFHLNIGQPDLPTPQVAIDAIRNIDRKVLEYSPSAGYRSYREKLVGYYEKYNIHLTADDIIVTSGGSEAVLFSFMACLNPGDEIIVPEPAYANYMAFAISAGAKIRTIATTIEEGFSLPKVEKFEELINERTRAILICNPNNPTGYLYTRREMNQIRDLVKKYDLFLFSDEVYREFIYTGSPYISACHLEGIEQNVVLIDSVSKRYSECGIRIGALITKNKEIRDAVMKFCQARLSPPLIGQIAAEASLDAGEDYLRDTYDEYVERRKCLIDGLNRTRCLFAHSDGSFLYRGQVAGGRFGQVLCLVFVRLRIRRSDGIHGTCVGLLHHTWCWTQRSTHCLCVEKGRSDACPLCTSKSVGGIPRKNGVTYYEPASIYRSSYLS